MTATNPHVLIVDDEPLNRELLCRVLQGCYQLKEAGDAAEALAILEGEHAIELIVSDHLMPGRTGAELAVIVGERWPHIPFMLLTGFDGDEEVQRVVDQGIIKAVLCKPWRSRELREAIALQIGH